LTRRHRALQKEAQKTSRKRRTEYEEDEEGKSQKRDCQEKLKSQNAIEMKRRRNEEDSQKIQRESRRKIKNQKAWRRSNDGGSMNVDRNKLSQEEREKLIPY
jgi:hypothetical protein